MKLASVRQLLFVSLTVTLIAVCSGCATTPAQFEMPGWGTTGLVFHGSKSRQKLTVWNIYNGETPTVKLSKLKFNEIASSAGIDSWSVLSIDAVNEHEQQSIKEMLDAVQISVAKYRLHGVNHQIRNKLHIVPNRYSYIDHRTQAVGKVIEFDIFKPARNNSVVESTQLALNTSTHELFHLYKHFQTSEALKLNDLYEEESLAYFYSLCAMKEAFGDTFGKSFLAGGLVPEEVLTSAQTQEDDDRIIHLILRNYHIFKNTLTKDESYLQRTSIGRAYVIYKLYSGLDAAQSSDPGFIKKQCEAVFVDEQYDLFLEELRRPEHSS